MIIEAATIQGLTAASLALTATDRLHAARRPFVATPGALLTALLVLALIISVIVVFWAIGKRKQSERLLKQKIARLTSTNEKLLEEIAGLKQEHEESVVLSPEGIISLRQLAKRLSG
jgi:Tfp pilus assembly protein PilN